MNEKLIALVLATIFFLTLLSGCFEEKSTEDEIEKTEEKVKITGINFNMSNYPKVDSSTSAYPINKIVACKILNASYKWITPFTGTYHGALSIESEDENISNFIDYINVSGTHGSYMNLIDGNVDLTLAARLPSEDELNYADNKSIELVTEPIARDAFVFITNIKNTVDSLTVQEIKDIYTGNITNWNEVGGKSVNITAYQRNKNSGSQELMETLVMKGLEMANLSELILYGMGGPFDKIIYDDGSSISYTVYYYKKFLTNTSDSIKMLGINGVVPSYQTIKDEEYEYVTNVYAVIRKDLDKESGAYKLRDWLLTEEGQSVIKETGYVPIV